MKILKPVGEDTLMRGAERWTEVIEALKNISFGMALPVDCDSKAEASSLAYFILQRNRKIKDKFKISRRGTAVFISPVSIITKEMGII